MTIQVQHFELRDWEELIKGVVLMENEEWTLIHELPDDFSTDGYALLQKNQISDQFTDEETEISSLVLQLKGYQPEFPADFKLGRTEEMLKWIENTYGLVQIQDQEEMLYVGTIQSIVANELRLRHIDPLGYEDPAMVDPIFLTDLQLVQFGSDYMRSMRLLADYREKAHAVEDN